jgi:hypothetical protein
LPIFLLHPFLGMILIFAVLKVSVSLEVLKHFSHIGFSPAHHLQ